MKVVITGLSREGKSTIALAICTALAEHGIHCQVDDEVPDAAWYQQDRQTSRLEKMSTRNVGVSVVVKNALTYTPTKYNFDKAKELLTTDEVNYLKLDNRVACVKSIRRRTGLGLYDAMGMIKKCAINGSF